MRRKGFTLIEVLVALAIFGLLTGVIVAVFVVAHRYTRLYQQVSTAQREAVQCLRQMTREFSRGSAQTLTSPTAGVNATWFLSNKPREASNVQAEFTNLGAVKWHKWVGLWCQSNGEVRRSEIQLAGGPQPFNLVNFSSQPGLLSDFQAQPQTHRLASHIVRFQATADSRIITLDIRSEAHLPNQPATRYHLISSILCQ